MHAQVVNFPLVDIEIPFEIIVSERNVAFTGTAVILSRSPYSNDADIRDPLGELYS